MLSDLLTSSCASTFPESLVVNFDQTGLQIVPTRGVTSCLKGAQEVPILWLDDKRQITAVLAATAYGSLLPVQLIFQGKTVRCLPSKAERNEYEQIGWHFTMTANPLVELRVNGFILMIHE